MQKNKQVIVAVCLGNFLELFDFTVYSYFSVFIAKVFFQNISAEMGLLISVSIFAIAFFVRPLGAILLGVYADHKGARSGLILCLFLMGVGTFFIAAAPRPEVAGSLGVTMIILGRFLSGISAGGEIGSGLTMLLDHASQTTRDVVGAWQMTMQGVSGLCGAILAFVLTENLSQEALLSWGWRVPFLIALLIIPLGYYIRAQTRDFISTMPVKNKVNLAPLKELFQQYWQRFFLLCGLGGGTSASLYILWFYLSTYFYRVGGIDMKIVYPLTIFSFACSALLPLISGRILDLLSKKYPRMYLRQSVIMISFALLLFFVNGVFFSTHHLGLFIFFYVLSTITLSVQASVSLVFLGDSFPRHIRATAVSFAHASYVAVFGGTAQIIVTFLLNVTNNAPYAPLIYLTPLLSVSLWSAWRIRKYL